MATYDHYLDQIAELLKKDGFNLDDTQRTVIRTMWEGWEADRPAFLEQSANGSPSLLLIAEAYNKQYATGYSSSSSSWVSITNHPATCELKGMKYLFTDTGELKHTENSINFSNRDEEIARIKARTSEDEISLRDFEQIIDKDMLSSHVGSLAASVSAYIQSLTGQIYHDEIVPILTNREQERLQPFVDTFMSHLDHDVDQIMKQTKLYNSRIANWFNHQEYGTYRLQAANAFPIFTRIFSGGFRHENRYQREETQARNDKLNIISSTIDKGEPLLPALEKHLCDIPLSTALLRNLGKIKECPQDMNYKSFLDALPYLEKIDINYHPKTGEELEAFIECIARAEEFEKSTGRRLTDILQNIKGKWQEWLTATVSNQEAKDVKDWLNQVKKTVIMPLVLQQIKQENEQRPQGLRGFFSWASSENPSIRQLERNAEQRADFTLKEVFNNVSEGALVACSHKWHENAGDYATQLDALGVASYDDLCSWTPLSEPVRAPNGIWLRPLTSKVALREEGTKLKHCVGNGSYGTQCLAGQDHIISLSRDENGQDKLTTVQLRERRGIKGEVKTLEVMQHQGLKRRAPSNMEKEAIEWYRTTLLLNPDMKPDWETIDSTRAEARKKRNSRDAESRIGFDPYDLEKCEVAYDIIRSYLPGKFGKSHYELATPRFERSLPSTSLVIG